MGRSSKKSDAKVAAPAPAVKPAKKGKRDAEEALEKLASAKKQKTKVKFEKKAAPPPKKVDTSSSEDDSSESEEEVKVPTKKDNKPAKTLANESSSSEELSSDEEIDAKASVPSKKLPATGAKNGAALVSKKKNESSDSSDSDSSSDDEPSSKKKPSQPVAKKQLESSDISSESDSSGDEEVMQAIVALPSATVKPTVAPSNVTPRNGLKKNKSSDSESDSSKDESDVKKVLVSVTPSKPNAKAVKKESSSDEDESEDEEDSSDDEPPKTQKNSTDTDVKMKDTQSGKKEPKTPSQSQPSGSKTLFVGNLSYDVDQDQLSKFFEKAGEVVGVRLATGEDGSFRGFGHVEFASEAAAQKAMEMNGETLLGRAVRLDLARERGAYTSQSGRESNSYQKGGQRQGQTIFVKGFDKSVGEDEVRSSLQDHFGSCGQISRLSIPPDHETGAPKGIAYIDFKDQDGASQALELNGSDLGGYTLTVDEAKPRGDSRDGGYSGGRGGGRGGRDSGGRGGRFGGRGRGRDGGGRGGRGRGGRGRGGRGSR